MTTPIFQDPGVRGSNKISGAQLDHRPIIVQKELILYHSQIQRIRAHKKSLTDGQTDRQTDDRTPDNGRSHKLDWSLTSRAKNDIIR